MRGRRDTRAFSTLRRYPWITRRLSKPSGKYLSVLSDEFTDDDKEWVGERILAKNADSDANLEKVRLAYALARAKPLASHGRELFDVARSSDRIDDAAVADAFAFASGRSLERPRTRIIRSVQVAMDKSDLNAKRAFLAAARDDASSREVRIALDALLRLDPDVRPTIEWIRQSGR